MATLLHPLSADAALALRVDRDLLPLVAHWLPAALADGDPSKQTATIVVRRGHGDPGIDTAAAPTLALGAARAWIDDQRQRAVLLGDDGCVAQLRLAERHAAVVLPAVGNNLPSLYSMLTVAAALVLGRMGRALIHAGAVVRPGGGAWLVVGDARAGKTTTCVNLVAGGWDYLSDDQVVLAPADAGSPVFLVDGWLRRFHLDQGWAKGERSGARGDFDPASLAAGRWTRQARLEGLLLTRVEPSEPTRLATASEGDAVAALIRQSPWLMADRARAGGGLDLHARVAAHPRYTLRLGRDTYRDHERLAWVLAPLADARG